jgi:hypothetical protein
MCIQVATNKKINPALRSRPRRSQRSRAGAGLAAIRFGGILFLRLRDRQCPLRQAAAFRPDAGIVTRRRNPPARADAAAARGRSAVSETRRYSA